MKNRMFWLLQFRGILFWILSIMLVMASCNPIEDNAPGMNATGHLKLLITDDPIQWQDIAEVNVTIDKVVLKMETDEEENDEDDSVGDDHIWDGMGHSSFGDSRMGGDWEDDEDEDEDSSFIVVLDSPMVINLLELRNGVTMLLSEMDIPAGSYNQVRIYISSATLMMTDGTEFDLEIPSALSSGLKIFIEPALVIGEGETEELLLDIDLSRSLIILGSSDDPEGFIFRPVIRSACNSTSGRVEGFVRDISGDGVTGASVWLEGDSVVNLAISNESGFYKMIGIHEGSYTLFAAMEGYDTARVENIQITATGIVQTDIELVPGNLNGIFVDPGPDKLYKIIKNDMIAGFLRRDKQETGG